jgi:PIN domain nuclease of toxin-antitoxin system
MDSSAAVLADTHILLWSLFEPEKLSANARQAIEAAEEIGDPIWVSVISLIELRYLVEKGKFTESDFEQCLAAFDEPDAILRWVAINDSIARRLHEIERDIVPDMPDRIIAATAAELSVPCLTKDGRIQQLKAIRTIW